MPDGSKAYSQKDIGQYQKSAKELKLDKLNQKKGRSKNRKKVRKIKNLGEPLSSMTDGSKPFILKKLENSMKWQYGYNSRSRSMYDMNSYSQGESTRQDRKKLKKKSKKDKRKAPKDIIGRHRISETMDRYQDSLPDIKETSINSKVKSKFERITSKKKLSIRSKKLSGTKSDEQHSKKLDGNRSRASKNSSYDIQKFMTKHSKDLKFSKEHILSKSKKTELRLSKTDFGQNLSQDKDSHRSEIRKQSIRRQKGRVSGSKSKNELNNESLIEIEVEDIDLEPEINRNSQTNINKNDNFEDEQKVLQDSLPDTVVKELKNPPNEAEDIEEPEEPEQHKKIYVNAQIQTSPKVSEHFNSLEKKRFEEKNLSTPNSNENEDELEKQILSSQNSNPMKQIHPNYNPSTSREHFPAFMKKVTSSPKSEEDRSAKNESQSSKISSNGESNNYDYTKPGAIMKLSRISLQKSQNIQTDDVLIEHNPNFDEVFYKKKNPHLKNICSSEKDSIMIIDQSRDQLSNSQSIYGHNDLDEIQSASPSHPHHGQELVEDQELSKTQSNMDSLETTKKSIFNSRSKSKSKDGGNSRTLNPLTNRGQEEINPINPSQSIEDLVDIVNVPHLPENEVQFQSYNHAQNGTNIENYSDLLHPRGQSPGTIYGTQSDSIQYTNKNHQSHKRIEEPHNYEDYEDDYPEDDYWDYDSNYETPYTAEGQIHEIETISSINNNVKQYQQAQNQQKQFLSATNNIQMIDEQIELDYMNGRKKSKRARNGKLKVGSLDIYDRNYMSDIPQTSKDSEVFGDEEHSQTGSIPNELNSQGELLSELKASNMSELSLKDKRDIVQVKIGDYLQNMNENGARNSVIPISVDFLKEILNQFEQLVSESQIEKPNPQKEESQKSKQAKSNSNSKDNEKIESLQKQLDEANSELKRLKDDLDNWKRQKRNTNEEKKKSSKELNEMVEKARAQAHEQFKMELDLLNKERDNLKLRNSTFLQKIQELEQKLSRNGQQKLPRQESTDYSFGHWPNGGMAQGMRSQTLPSQNLGSLSLEAVNPYHNLKNRTRNEPIDIQNADSLATNKNYIDPNYGQLPAAANLDRDAKYERIEKLNYQLQNLNQELNKKVDSLESQNSDLKRTIIQNKGSVKPNIDKSDFAMAPALDLKYLEEPKVPILPPKLSRANLKETPNSEISRALHASSKYLPTGDILNLSSFRGGEDPQMQEIMYKLQNQKVLLESEIMRLSSRDQRNPEGAGQLDQQKAKLKDELFQVMNLICEQAARMGKRGNSFTREDQKYAAKFD